MTTRFSMAELAEMLHENIEHVRIAVDSLAAAGQLTGESFQFGHRNWRIAPSDVKNIAHWLVENREHLSQHPLAEKQSGRGQRRVVRKVISAPNKSHQKD
ncbi:hypothetical protein FY534_10460 [Alicyclobacillus sp. TC]|uniref:hypothetical protein n=1 Tax=Alicyclobacillus sp. TC TaxID=2606450 RepID=UPI001932BA33|nr:hypothetical protein [Alicyclobacillus sp. TC]QRF24012.1 hypothetical protein FY534_10460 [Alicyclobacillus sp. TC]